VAASCPYSPPFNYDTSGLQKKILANPNLWLGDFQPNAINQKLFMVNSTRFPDAELASQQAIEDLSPRSAPQAFLAPWQLFGSNSGHLLPCVGEAICRTGTSAAIIS
jgi:hypothetical protein